MGNNKTKPINLFLTNSNFKLKQIIFQLGRASSEGDCSLCKKLSSSDRGSKLAVHQVFFKGKKINFATNA